uniref:NADH-ubiquinone oxidoreductase chain 5 n=1 Tax=Octopus variabilis TaxID=158018 RepID=A0A344AY07_9MOLL|nr:NADH dehydrogenase subunit 5 [Octopus variabilis]
MNKLKIEIFFSLILMLFSCVWGVLFLCLVLNNCCYIISWEIFNSMNLFVELDILFDWVSCSFGMMVCLISSSVSIFSVSYMKGDMNSKRFMLVLMLFVMSMNFLIFIPSFVSLILGWDGLGLVSFCLVIYYQNNKSLSAGMLTVLMNRVGDCFILGGISIMALLGHWNYLCIWYFWFFDVCMIFVVVAGMTKSAQIPFSSWLPAAMAAPTPVSALVHSSTLVTAGFFLLIFFYYCSMKIEYFGMLMIAISIITTFMSGVCAVYEYDMKKIIALSTLKQLGVMMMSLGMKMPMLALFHLYTHAMFKALLFLCGGNIIHFYDGFQVIRDVKGVSYNLPLTSVVFNICKMASFGFSFSVEFYSKDMIIEMLLSSNMNLLMWLFGKFGVCLNMMYSMRMFILMMWGYVKSMVYDNMWDYYVFVVYLMMILCFGAFFGGFSLQSLVMNLNEVIVLPIFYKLLVLMLTSLFMLLSLKVWGLNSSKQKYKILYWCNSKMWFLSFLSGNPCLIFMNLKWLEMVKLQGNGWLEMLGGQGLLLFLKKVMLLMERWMVVMFNVNMIVIIFILIFM